MDLDGTFVFDSVEVSHADLRAFKILSKNMYTAVATGRSVKEINHIELENKIDLDYLIGFNGALVVDRDGNVLHDQPIPKQKLVSLLEFIKEENLIFDALDGNERIGNFQHENPDSLWNMNLICVENPFAMLEDKTIYKINLRPSRETSDSLYKRLKELFPNLSIYQTGKTRIEITDEGISKGSVLSLCKQDENTEVLAVGDSENDITMFEEADISFCLNHATPKVSRYATHLINRFSDLALNFQ